MSRRQVPLKVAAFWVLGLFCVFETAVLRFLLEVIDLHYVLRPLIFSLKAMRRRRPQVLQGQVPQKVAAFSVWGLFYVLEAAILRFLLEAIDLQ